ncbi:hypothetical protein OHA98_13950 [Streptomyces sp. NBC_00654]|uniref:hypothetical protein n=1 Tax=Streptomyces sp. NBC_00654 TaxID=2975799 RepID=UPI00224D1A6D|nr:hypothetical protein [Streptomyces sp. NBC_00654]MCX4965924.1 hypothetical protein [Streptomyces sp. NBC_00654]
MTGTATGTNPNTGTGTGTGAGAGTAAVDSAARRDLLALTPDTLAALANRGLVKRATKELDAGAVPAVTTDPDATVRARFEDGTATALPHGAGLDNGACSCAAPGVCRHLIILVLAYQRAATPSPERPPASSPETGTGAEPDAGTRSTTDAGTAPGTGAGADRSVEPGSGPATHWSPGSADDGTLTAAFGARALGSARRAFERGYAARVHRPTADRPEPWVELPTCTVRFPVPGEIAYALTDAATVLKGEVVALAVWAFREADRTGESILQVGGGATAHATARPQLDMAAGLADELLLSGTAHASPVLGGALARAGEALSSASLHWPAGAVAELTEQLSAYAARGAHYRPERVAELLTEIHARRRAAALPGVLGTREAGDTPLRRVALTSLGCRIRTAGNGTVAEVYFAHPGAATVLVLRKEWAAAEGQRTTGHRLATRRVLGSTLAALATGNLISESVRRTASRALTVSRGRLGATSITPVGASWADLAEPLLVRDLAALTAAWDGRPPRLVRPRIEAETVRVIALSDVESVGYDPAEQRLEAVVRDTAGTRALVCSGYRPECPGSLDALADALAGGATRISGAVHRTGGGIRIDPIAVQTPAGVVVPDLAPGDGSTALAAVERQASDPLTSALEEALAALAAVAHSGLRHLPEPARARIDEAATALAGTGLSRSAELLRAFLNTGAGTGTGDAERSDEDARSAAWLEAQLHLLVSSELRAAETP